MLLAIEQGVCTYSANAYYLTNKIKTSLNCEVR